MSGNSHKHAEAKAILEPSGFEVEAIKFPVKELQTMETEKLVRHKALEAFKKVGHRVFVEHTGLYLAKLNDFPGGLTEIFQEKLGAEIFSELFGGEGSNKVTAKTVVCYVDSQDFHTFDGEIAGIISRKPVGPPGFQWDPVFIPDGYDKTFAELGTDVKNKISMRKLALEKFAKYLREVEADAN